jgi:hypothetical protein
MSQWVTDTLLGIHMGQPLAIFTSLLSPLTFVDFRKLARGEKKPFRLFIDLLSVVHAPASRGDLSRRHLIACDFWGPKYFLESKKISINK